MDSFVGRTEELDDLGRLAGQYRILTVVGPAGVGKTRLVREFTADGVWVELSSVPHTDLFVQSVAAALGVAEEVGEAVVQTIIRTLGDQQLLLVLDNCEHVAAEAASLAEALLVSCQGLRILATSREALRLPGEVVFPVRPLPIDSAVQLFSDRAKANRLGLTFDDTDTEVVSQVCARLDGLPLAIELAARLITVLPVTEVLARLDDRLALLNRGNRTAASRHQSLRAAIEWSWDSLNADEQRVFRRLSPLVGGFGLDIAVAICADEQLSANRVIGLLSALVDKSLLAASTTSGDTARFDQLETLRLYGKEKLEEAGEVDSTNGRVVDWFMLLWEQFTNSVLSSSDVVDQLRAERGSLQMVVEWASRTGDSRELPLAIMLAVCWRDQGYVTDGRRLLDSVLETGGGVPADHCLALAHLAYLAGRDADHAAAHGYAVRAVELATSLDSPIALARALNCLGAELLAVGKLSEARRHYEKCVELLVPLGRTLDIATSKHNLAWAALQDGDLEYVDQLIAEINPVYRRLAPPRKLAVFLHTVGAYALCRGDVDEAEKCFVESLKVCSSGSFGVAYVLEGLAIVAARKGDPRRVLRLVGAVSRMLTAGQAQQEPRWRNEVATAALAAHRALPVAEAEEALAAGRNMDRDQVVGCILRDASREASELPLSYREREVALLVSAGHTNLQIATKLQISERTVEAHLHHIRQKLCLRSRTQVATWVAQRM